MRHGLEFNARSVPPADVARSFVPPEPHFVRLLSRNHTLVLGPRGSGKTTLLKMLTVRALSNWDDWQARDFARQITFNAAFVPADNAWGKQLDSLVGRKAENQRKEAAFVIHTLRGLIHAMREAAELGRKPVEAHLAHLAVKMTAKQEEQFVQLVSNRLAIAPALNTLLGVEVALEDKLDQINSGDAEHTFSVDAFPSKLALLITAFNGIIGDDDRRWAILFDEMEIAPSSVKSFLLSGIRSFDERIIIKVAIAPYMDDVQFDQTPTSPQPFHDYQTVQLSYPNKDEATHFGNELFLRTLQRLGFDTGTLGEIFRSPSDTVGFGRRPRTSLKRGEVPQEFLSLAKKDESFNQYVQEKGFLSSNYVFSEPNIAQDIRKVLPIVLLRDYYLRKFQDGHPVLNRSRKTYSLYSGMPSIVEITEGNPRAILTLIIPLVQEFEQYVSRTNSTGAVPTAIQSAAISRVELLLTSLLRVIPLDLGGFEPGKGLLDFVDHIGRAFEDRLLRRPFSTDYVGTFVVDDNLTPAVVAAVGKALNAGAFVHVPYPDSGPDALLRGLRGQRFRLSYALAPRYRLLLTLGDRISLSKLLLEMRGVNLAGPQHSFFESDDSK